MISLKDLADEGTHISSTRWAFCLVIIFDIVVIFLTVCAALFGHFAGNPIDSSIFTGVATLLGVPTALISAAKVMQGFEHHEK